MNDRLPGADELLERARNEDMTWAGLAELVLDKSQSDGEHQPDLDRARRCGFGEVIFGSGKSASDIARIAKQLIESGQNEVLVTRIAPEHAAEVAPLFQHSRHDSLGRTLRLSSTSEPLSQLASTAPPALPLRHVSVVTAGSTDIAIAREAVETLHWMQINVSLTTDVGVAGPYRLLTHLEHLRRSSAVVVIAGMEGALASVVGGLLPCPIIAVPTSVGYGSNFEGITTLLSMMSSCAAGVTTVNIDAGFKGGYVAGLIAAQHAETSH
ncbi:MAG: nickel pincer cofactor biosynthesis protein LarB [Aureliella sp.]